MTETKAIIAIAIISLVTIVLRFLPFLLFSGKKTPKAVTYLGGVLPCAMIGMLVVYCLKDVSLTSVSGFLPELIASAAVVLTYLLFKKNTLLSIISSTAVYMILIQFVF